MLSANTTLQHGRYRIIRPIGRGGMGAVYKAYDSNLSNRVALKEALASDASQRHAFEREAQRLDRLRHPALPTVKDYFVEGGGQYLVMEFIDGQDLGQILRQQGQPFPVAQVLGWADRLLDALTYLHTRNPPLIHRDIKPANLKLSAEGQIILLDFGLAKGGLSQHTLTGYTLFGYTPGYAPLEQIQGQPTDERSDLYALGATVYALLTGGTPDDATLRQKYVARGYPDPLPLVNQVNPQVPPHVAQALQRALALDPTQRPASAAEMRALLNAPPAKAPLLSTIRGANTQTWLLSGAMIVAVLLLFCGLLGIYASARGDDGPVVVVDTPIPTPTEVIVPPATIPVTPTVTPPPPATSAPAAPEVPAPTATATPTATAEPTATTAPAATPTVVPTLGVGSTAIAQKDGMVQLYVPAGDFEMGSAQDYALDHEKPRHTVYLDAFWIDRTEVTNAMFANFVQQTGYQTDAEKEGSGWACLPRFDGGFDCGYVDGADWQHPQGPERDFNGLESHPVVQVSSLDATAYCEWAERRLPTEAQWEKAAGGVLTEEATRKWPWGNEPPTGDVVNFCDQNCAFGWKDSSTNDGYRLTSPVGNYPNGASPYGAWDMAGNVSEWVSDNYDPSYYASSPRENPPGSATQGYKVLRGGSSNDSPSDIRVHSRDWTNPDYRVENFGFRCAR
ncbi:MAG: SUMF1/EgtB/PvdO family nonheme iron enzyme [Ardenticatenaceae bacterium]